MSGKSNDARTSTEFSGRTVAEALKRASDTLGIPVEALEYETVRDSSHSILGFMRTGEVVIRAWASETATPVVAATAATEPVVAEPTVAENPIQDAPAAVAAPKTGIVIPRDDEEGSAKGQSGNPAELEKVAKEVLATLVDKMDLIAAVEVQDKGGELDPESNEVSPLALNIVGDDLGALIGRRGETLRDLQFITRLIISRKIGVWPNVVIDVEGYKSKRVSALRALALRMADQVRQTQRPVFLEPMPAHERRIIHLTLRDASDVSTQSSGEGEERKVQILPK